MVEHEMYCRLAAELSTNWSKVEQPEDFLEIVRNIMKCPTHTNAGSVDSTIERVLTQANNLWQTAGANMPPLVMF